MSAKTRPNLTVWETSIITATTQPAVYKAIHKKKMPSIKVVGEDGANYLTPVAGMEQWFDKKILKCENDAKLWKNRKQKMIDYANGKIEVLV